MNYKIIYKNELTHHGILGQKWGARRYQNPDGTLTDAGKKRYDKQVSNLEKRYARINKNMVAPSEKRLKRLQDKQFEAFWQNPMSEKNRNLTFKVARQDKYVKDIKAFVDQMKQMEMDNINEGTYTLGRKMYSQYIRGDGGLLSRVSLEAMTGGLPMTIPGGNTLSNEQINKLVSNYKENKAE